MKIDKATIARTIILSLSLINIVLQVFGIKALPISDDLVNELVSVGFLLYSAVSSWWHNNSFTSHAKQADEYLKELRNSETK